MKPRIAIFLPGLRAGGTERAMLNLAEGIVLRGFPLELVLARAEGELLGDVPAGANIVDLGASRVLTSLIPLALYLRRVRPAAMLSVMDYANIIALWARSLAGTSTRVVISVRTTLSKSLPHAVSRAQVVPLLMRCYYPRADGVVCVSRGVADDLKSFVDVPAERVKVIYNPAITASLERRLQAKVEDPWLHPGEPPVVISVGRLTTAKDFSTLIRAFAQVAQRRAARLLILGEGSQRSALELLVRQLGLQDTVRMPGFVANPLPYVKKAAVFVLSSAWEGMPNAMIEAMACGTPVVATDCQSGPREILQDGKYGKLVPVGAVDQVAEAILQTLDQSCRCRPDEALKRFELAAVTDSYLSCMLPTGDSG